MGLILFTPLTMKTMYIGLLMKRTYNNDRKRHSEKNG